MKIKCSYEDKYKETQEDTKDKMNQICKYIQRLLTGNYKNENIKNTLHEERLLDQRDVILLGGIRVFSIL